MGLIGAGAGKAQPLTEPVLTPQGFKPMGSLSVGDQVITQTGLPTQVIGVYPQGVKEIFTVRFSDGSAVRCTEDHLWVVRQGKIRKDAPWETLSLKEIRKEVRGRSNRKTFDVPLPQAVVFSPTKPLTIPAYTMGVLLGDGGLTRGNIEVTSGDRDREQMLGLLQADSVGFGWTAKERVNKDRCGGIHLASNQVRPHPLKTLLGELGLLGTDSHTKFIPKVFKDASVEDRTALLQGLMDSDGTVDCNGSCSFSSASKTLLDDFVYLASSLGCLMSPSTSKVSKIDGKAYSLHYRVTFRPPFNPFRLDFKKNRFDSKKYNRCNHKYIVSVERTGEEQAQCIAVEAKEHTYLTSGFTVTHNTDLSALLANVFQSKRTLILVPAALRQKTMDDFSVLRSHWVFPACFLADEASTVSPGDPVIRILSYESLSTVGYATFIEEFDPELIIADEAHALQSMKSGRARRVFRFIKAKRKRKGKIHYVPMTGTGWSKSLKQIYHQFDASHEEWSPIPRDYMSIEQWSMCIDRGVKEDLRYGPGALLRLCPSEPNADLDTVRRAIRDRILCTPGVVSSKEVSCGLPLILQRRDITVPPEVRTAMKGLREDNVLPSGDSVPAGVTFWNHAREIANGFAYYYDPAPPDPWRKAKSAWDSFVRNAITASHGKLDTPLQVWNYVEDKVNAGQGSAYPEFVAWKAIRESFVPVTKPFWISDYLVRDAEDWALKTGGIVWVQHSTAHLDDNDDDSVGGRFTKIPYFGGGDERIKTYKGPCAASVRAHGTGKNLQQWDEALLMGFTSSGKTIEQLLARHHREGQKSDIVKFHFYAHSKENLNAVETCLLDAEYIEATSGAEQRIRAAHLLDADGHAFMVERYREKQSKQDPMWG